MTTVRQHDIHCQTELFAWSSVLIRSSDSKTNRKKCNIVCSIGQFLGSPCQGKTIYTLKAFSVIDAVYLLFSYFLFKLFIYFKIYIGHRWGKKM